MTDEATRPIILIEGKPVDWKKLRARLMRAGVRKRGGIGDPAVLLLRAERRLAYKKRRAKEWRDKKRAEKIAQGWVPGRPGRKPPSH